MGYHNGPFNGDWADWKPTYISGCNLWLPYPGAVSNTIWRVGTAIALWMDHSQDLLFEGDPVKSYSMTSSEGFTDSTRINSSFTTVGGASCTKIQMDGNNSAVWYYIKNASETLSVPSYMELDIYVPSENTEVTGIYSYYAVTGNGGGLNAKTVSKRDTWITVSAYMAQQGSSEFQILLASGSVLNWATNNTTDYIGVKNIRYTAVLGNHFIQNTTSAKPYYSSSNSSVAFDGTTDFLDGTANIDNFRDDTQGCYFIVGNKTTKYSHIGTYMLDSSDSNRYVNVGMWATGSAAPFYNSSHMYWRDDGADQLITGTTTKINTGSFITMVSADGTSTQIYTNNISQTIDDSWVDPDAGNWYGQHPDKALFDSFTLMKLDRPSPLYYSGEISEIIYYNRRLTNKERSAVFQYLNSIHNIY